MGSLSKSSGIANESECMDIKSSSSTHYPQLSLKQTLSYNCLLPLSYENSCHGLSLSCDVPLFRRQL